MNKGLPTFGGAISRADSRSQDLTSRLDKLYNFERAFELASNELDDISVKAERAAVISEKWARSMERVARGGRDLKAQLEENRSIQEKLLRDYDLAQRKLEGSLKYAQQHNKELGKKGIANQNRVKDLERSIEKNEKALEKLQEKLERMPSRLTTFASLFGDKVFGWLDKLGKNTTLAGLAAFSLGLHKLEEALHDVYELTERWVKLTGTFRLNIGAAGKSVDKLTTFANGMEGQLRALTGEFGLSHKEMEGFVKSFGFVDKRMDGFYKNAILMGRAMGIGTEGAAALQHSLLMMGEGAGSDEKLFAEIVTGADAAGVSVSSLGKEIVDSRDFLASFGKTGKSVFVQAASFARSLGMSLKSLEAFTKGTDTFDSTVESMAKLNTVFGTSMNALSMVLEEDPSKRLESVRRELKMQGKDLDTLSRREKDLLAETLHISKEELNGIISSGETLESFQKKQAKEQKMRAKDAQFWQDALDKTTQTLIAFSNGWDQITNKIKKLIAPFTDMLGLTGDTVTFGKVMQKIFDRVAGIIDDIANNADWKYFIEYMASETKDLIKWLNESLSKDNIAGFIKTLTTGATDFYNAMKSAVAETKVVVEKLWPLLQFIVENSGKIALIWGGGKLAAGAIRAVRGVGAAVDFVKDALAAREAARASLPQQYGPAKPTIRQTAGRWARSIGSGISSGVSAVGRGVVRFGRGALNMGGSLVRGAAGMGARAATATFGALTAAASATASTIASMGRSIGSALLPAMSSAAAGLSSFGSYLTGPMSSALGSVAGKLGAAGLVGAAALAGVAIGRFIGSLEVGGKSIDDWVVLGYEKIGEFFKGLWKSFKESRLGKYLGMSDTSGELQKQMSLSDQTAKSIEEAFFRANSSKATQKDKDFLADMARIHGDTLIEYMAKRLEMQQDQVRKTFGATPMASGGIVMRPTRAIVGESGPEAIIPLKAIATANAHQPAKFGGEATKRLVNFAAGKSSGGSGETRIVAGDIYLDGQKVGRHLVRELLVAEAV